MDPTLSTADAHVLFGKLYRQFRSPELQKKVEDVVSSTSDVFVRIKKIEDIDAQFKQDNKGVELKKISNRPRSAGPVNGRTGKKPPIRKKSKSGSGGNSGGGFFARLFGNEISRWGTRTGTLDGGIFSRNPVLSPRVYQLFKVLSDSQIKSSARIFKGLLGTIWEELEPARYNVLIAAYQFIIEFVKTEAIIRNASETEDLSTSTLRMQKSYAMMINFPDYETILLNDFTKIVHNSKEFSSESGVIKTTMKTILSLDDRKPGLKNSILAFYVITRKKMINWDEICRELKVGVPQTKEYRAPEAVMEVIHKKILSLKNRYKENKIQIIESTKIKEEFLETDANGKLKVDFLTPIVEDALRRIFNEHKLSAPVIKSYKTEPHKLLYCLMKDMELNIIFLFANTVMTKAEGQHSEEVMIFKPGMFTRPLTKFMEIFRVLEQFMRAKKDMSYSFTDYLQDLREPPEMAERKEFIKITGEVLKIIKIMVDDLHLIWENHEGAIELEKFGQATDVLNATKSIPIDSLEAKPRYIPFYEREVFASSRMNGSSADKIIKDYVKFLYNYLYIFREPEFLDALGSATAKSRENERIKEDLNRMGIQIEA